MQLAQLQPRVSYAPPLETIDVLPPLAVSAPPVYGMPSNMSPPRLSVSYAPKLETVDVPPPLSPGLMLYGPWLDAPAVFSRYTIITPYQDAVALLPPIGGPDGVGSASIGTQATGTGSQTMVGAGAAAIALTASGTSSGGISGTGSATITLAASGTVTETMAGSGAATTDLVAGGFSGASGIGGTGAASTSVTASATGDNTTYGGGYIAPAARALRVARVPVN